MNTNTLLIERTRAAASIYFPADSLPELSTIEECRRSCAQMNIKPEELIAPNSRVWQVILMCQQMKEGSAVFTFRGDGSHTIIQQTITEILQEDR
ncbi:hypothetical protein [Corynebacterium suicordis]|uniref:Uncharacterized protein n=1 Tax=Corynebacterium suicordis DSM 45110 TaxID=1121369 RepID=A0ABR9ZLQ4_9CORY|nr:hypothetical protein [Corynebacterium suicordis]MBF4554370.1 hypothetical protein [Corynebacterium suicordis DSM 45110]MDR6278606.1 hypothetical protein [Corynebacterium suicordis]